MRAEETRSEAEKYAAETRAATDSYARETKETAEQEAREAIRAAEAEARRIVEEGTRRREDIEAVIADLLRRRDEVLTDTEELTGKLTRAVSEHRAAPGADELSRPDEDDPLAHEGAPTEPVDAVETAVSDADEAESEQEADLRS
jgi:hypothetical protein